MTDADFNTSTTIPPQTAFYPADRRSPATFSVRPRSALQLSARWRSRDRRFDIKRGLGRRPAASRRREAARRNWSTSCASCRSSKYKRSAAADDDQPAGGQTAAIGTISKGSSGGRAQLNSPAEAGHRREIEIGIKIKLIRYLFLIADCTDQSLIARRDWHIF